MNGALGRAVWRSSLHGLSHGHGTLNGRMSLTGLLRVHLRCGRSLRRTVRRIDLLHGPLRGLRLHGCRPPALDGPLNTVLRRRRSLWSLSAHVTVLPYAVVLVVHNINVFAVAKFSFLKERAVSCQR